MMIMMTMEKKSQNEKKRDKQNTMLHKIPPAGGRRQKSGPLPEKYLDINLNMSILSDFDFVKAPKRKTH